MGFVTPEQVWLTNELNDWIREIVSSETFKSRGYFDVSQIQKALNAHIDGKRNLAKLAWRWANLELWLRQMIDENPWLTDEDRKAIYSDCAEEFRDIDQYARDRTVRRPEVLNY